MSTTQDTLVAWLKDAHAMELQGIEILEKQAKRLEKYPQMQMKIEEHLDVSRRQAEDLNECLEQLDSDISTLKEAGGKLSGSLAAVGSAAARDEVVKDGIANYAFEHFEIASYHALLTAAETLGEEEIRTTCEDILHEEEEMAIWLEEHLPQVTQQYLQREENPRDHPDA